MLLLQACNITTYDFSPPTITNILFVCTPTTMPKIKIEAQKVDGSSADTTNIHNNTGRPIYLVPIRCSSTGNPEKTGTLEESLQRIIPAIKEPTKVKLDDYDYTKKRPGFQVHMLFCASDKDNFKEILNDFHNGRTTGELFHQSKLRGYDLNLDIVEAGQVIASSPWLGFFEVVSDEMLYIYKGANKGKEGQGTPSADVAGIISELKVLIKGIQDEQEALNKKIEDLQRKEKLLTKALDLLDQD